MHKYKVQIAFQQQWLFKLEFIQIITNNGLSSGAFLLRVPSVPLWRVNLLRLQLCCSCAVCGTWQPRSAPGPSSPVIRLYQWAAMPPGTGGEAAGQGGWSVRTTTGISPCCRRGEEPRLQPGPSFRSNPSEVSLVSVAVQARTVGRLKTH